MIRQLWPIAVLLCFLTPRAGAQVCSVDDQARWRVAPPGAPAAEGSLFLWHDRYKYETPRDVTREGQDWTGWLPASDQGARLTFRLAVKQSADGLDLRYTFRRDREAVLSAGMFVLVVLPLEPLRQRAARFSHSPAALAGGGFQGIGRSWSVNLTDQQALTLTADRVVTFDRRSDSPDRIAVNFRLLPKDFPADTEVPVSLAVRLTAAGSDKLPWELAMNQALAIRSARLAADRVPVNATATVEVDLAGRYDNPFDPEQVRLDADIAFPDGQVRRLPGYYHQDYTATRADDLELLEPVGVPGWRVRFTPTMAGRYSVKLTAADRTGTVTAAPLTLTAMLSTEPGMVRIGRHGRAFVREGGGAVFLIGHNVPTYLSGRPAMAESFAKMAAGGENFTRMWMYSRHLGLEWGQPAGTYRLAEAWRLDHAFELARQRGILVLLCLDTHQDFREKLRQHPYHREMGGAIDQPIEFFTNDQARRWYRQRLRYLVARWSHCTNLVAWEFANEIEGWQGFAEHQGEVAAWHAEMARALRELDPYRHPITTSCWTTLGWPTLWSAPGLDFVQSHHYANSRVDMAQRTVDLVRQMRERYPDRLLLFGEMGINSRFAADEGDDQDPTGVHLRKQSWAALLTGSASVPCNWWHEGYFEPHDLYGRFQGIARFAATLDLDRPWQPLPDLPVAWAGPPDPKVTRDLEFSGGAESWRPLPAAPVIELAPDGTVSGNQGLPGLLHGGGHRDLKVDWTFRLRAKVETSFELTVGEASNNPVLVALLDGREILRKSFVTAEGTGKKSVFHKQWNIWQTTYDEVVALPVPAGEHVLVLRNEGADWLRIDGFRLPGYLTEGGPPAQALAMTDGREAVLWVRNTLHWWRPVAESKTIPPVGPLRLTLPDLPAGRYRLEQWNTDTGEVVKTFDLTLPRDKVIELPALAEDAALRVVPKG